MRQRMGITKEKGSSQGMPRLARVGLDAGLSGGHIIFEGQEARDAGLEVPRNQDTAVRCKVKRCAGSKKNQVAPCTQSCSWG